MNRYAGVFAALALTGAAFWLATGAAPADAAHRPVPPPPAAAIGKPAAREVAVLAGGCFWGMEGVFEHVKGVISAQAGYAGGTAATAQYDTVSSETTNHAESVRITFDPRVVSYGHLLHIYFVVAHDPTQVDGQYPDQGRSYRSAIFPQSPAQRDLAKRYIATITQSHAFNAPIATRIEPGTFYPAEAWHQQFMRRNPNHPYIRRWDIARVDHLRTQFPQSYQ